MTYTRSTVIASALLLPIVALVHALSERSTPPRRATITLPEVTVTAAAPSAEGPILWGDPEPAPSTRPVARRFEPRVEYAWTCEPMRESAFGGRVANCHWAIVRQGKQP